MELENLKIDELKNKCQKIHFFGLGFIQLKLDEKFRLHFYHPELPAFVDEPHNHRYSFKSKVLKGELINSIYKIKIIYNANIEHELRQDLFIINDESCKKEEIKKEDGQCYSNIYCKIDKICEIKTLENSEYFLHKDEYHTIKPIGPTITLIERFEIEKEYAQVIKKINSVSICPFSKEIPENELWNLIRSML